MNPHDVTRWFEEELCKYTGASYAVVVNSCTNALLLACAYNKVEEVTIPKHTYVGVPLSIIHSGGRVKFENWAWSGRYQLKPYPIWDSAKLFTSGMYMPGQFICVSFHWSKTLQIGQGGAILHDNQDADQWLRKARFDGRSENVLPKDDKEIILGYHCYMSPRDSAEGLTRLSFLPKKNSAVPKDEYPDLSNLPIFKKPDGG